MTPLYLYLYLSFEAISVVFCLPFTLLVHYMSFIIVLSLFFLSFFSAYLVSSL